MIDKNCCICFTFTYCGKMLYEAFTEKCRRRDRQVTNKLLLTLASLDAM